MQASTWAPLATIKLVIRGINEGTMVNTTGGGHHQENASQVLHAGSQSPPGLAAYWRRVANMH